MPAASQMTSMLFSCRWTVPEPFVDDAVLVHDRRLRPVDVVPRPRIALIVAVVVLTAVQHVTPLPESNAIPMP